MIITVNLVQAPASGWQTRPESEIGTPHNSIEGHGGD